MNRHILQTVLGPSRSAGPEAAINKMDVPDEMFFHREGARICYDGYFNIFSCRKWSRYTTVDQVCLVLTGEGDFKITLFSERGELAEREIRSCREEIVIELPALTEQDFLWFSFEPCSPDARLKAGTYRTAMEPARIGIKVFL